MSETAEQPANDPPRAITRLPQDVSALAITATLAVVVLSIFLGVFGPRIGNHPGLTVGVPLSELALAVESRHGERFVNAVHANSGAQLAKEEAETALAKIISTPITLPDLERDGGWVSVDAVALPGGRAAVLFAQFPASRGFDYVTVCVFNDEDRFTVYNPFGRPIGLPDGEVFVVEPVSEFGGTMIVAWRDSALVWVLAGGEIELLESLEGWIHASAFEKPLVREVEETPTPEDSR